MIQIAIVEDDKVSSDLLCSYIKHYNEQNDHHLFVTCFSNATDLVNDYKPIYDIIFLDIEMPGINGMDAAHIIREKDTSVILIFITNMAQYVMEGYSVQAMDFVLKPVSEYRFIMKLKKALKNISNRSAAFLCLKKGATAVKIDTADILYIDVFHHNLQVHTKTGTFSSPGSISGIESKLNPVLFSKCNNGTIINLSYVTSITKDGLYMNDDFFSFSRGCKKSFLQSLTDYMGGILQ